MPSIEELRKRHAEVKKSREDLLVEQELRDKNIIDMLIKVVTYAIQGNWSKAASTVGQLYKKVKGK